MRNRKIVITVVLALCLVAVSISALAADLSGTWASKSPSGDSASLITVKQSGDEIHVVQKFSLRSETRTWEYRLKTNWGTTEIPSPSGRGTISARAKWDKEKLIVHQIHKLKTVRVEEQDTWDLSPDGKLLTITSITEGPQGKQMSDVRYQRK